MMMEINPTYTTLGCKRGLNVVYAKIKQVFGPNIH